MLLNFANRDAAKDAWHQRFQNRTIKDRSESSLQVRNADDGSVEILLYDEIGFWGVTAKEFATKLAAISAPTITVRINSPGGDVFDGLAIYSSLVAHPAKINTVVEGLAASAASFIMLAGDTVTMAENSFAMIHRAWGLAIGNAIDLRTLASTLDKIDGQLAEMYAKKTGKSKDDMTALMDAETWFTAAEAKDCGLCDVVLGADDAAASATNVATDVFSDRVVNSMRRRLALAIHQD